MTGPIACPGFAAEECSVSPEKGLWSGRGGFGQFQHRISREDPQSMAFASPLAFMPVLFAPETGGGSDTGLRASSEPDNPRKSLSADFACRLRERDAGIQDSRTLLSVRTETKKEHGIPVRPLQVAHTGITVLLILILVWWF